MSADYSSAMLDTSTWVRIFEGDDAFADELARAQGDLPTVTSPLVLAELASIIARGRLDSDGAIAAVLSSALVESIASEDAIAAGTLHGSMRAAGHDKVALGDCLIYATAQRVGALLITCDADLAKRPGVAVLTPKRSRKTSR